jgi:hypothetical protein
MLIAIVELAERRDIARLIGVFVSALRVGRRLGIKGLLSLAAPSMTGDISPQRLICANACQ